MGGREVESVIGKESNEKKLTDRCQLQRSRHTFTCNNNP